MKVRCASWLLVCIALVTLGCAKGDRGPTGPAGPRGPVGTTNVIYSEWYSPATWVLETQFGIVFRTFTMTTTSLTQAVIDNGVVLVYIRPIGLNPAILQLPQVIGEYSFQHQSQAGSIKVLYCLTATPASDPGVIPPGNQVRYVLIPGGVLDAVASADGGTRDQLTTSLKSLSYADVCRKFAVQP